MATIEEIEQFLELIREKIKVFDIVFRPRDKNRETLQLLDIMPIERVSIIMSLTHKNFYAGPKKDNEDPQKPNYYEFGVNIKGEEVYIKINPGLTNKEVDCTSFHIAERQITYPYK